MHRSETPPYPPCPPIDRTGHAVNGIHECLSHPPARRYMTCLQRNVQWRYPLGQEYRTQNATVRVRKMRGGCEIFVMIGWVNVSK